MLMVVAGGSGGGSFPLFPLGHSGSSTPHSLFNWPEEEVLNQN